MKIVSNPFTWYWKSALYAAMFVVSSSCAEFIQIDPPKSQLVTSTAFSSDATAESAVAAIYNEMMNTLGFASGGFGSITTIAALSADELVTTDMSFIELEAFYTNSLYPRKLEVNNYIWEPGYKYVYYANAVLTGLADARDITEAKHKQLEGEAKFIRAFSYFYLTNLFGEVPLIVSIDYTKNQIARRELQEKVYDLIIDDLQDAERLLPANYAVYNDERIRPTKWAACAMLARVFLFRGDHINAEAKATSVINNTALFKIVDDLDSVFLANSAESVWQLMPVAAAHTFEGRYLIPDEFEVFFKMSPHLLNAFESGDKRRDRWVDTLTVAGELVYYPFKYKVRYSESEIAEYSMVLRLAELYLIRAEARVKQGEIDDAIGDLDVIRSRAGLPLIHDTNPLVTRDELLVLIIHERRIELFAEWGNRWLDLKRNNLADEVLKPILEKNWDATDALYPIPQSEIDNNPNMKPQNPGY